MPFKLHREGRFIIVTVLIFLIILNFIIRSSGTGSILTIAILIISALLMIFILRFFRKPHRNTEFIEGCIYSPCDGKVVVIEETNESEYFNDKRIQISIFMSVWNVHINWFPTSGLIKFFKYHPGKYLVARHPKSSVLNERTSVVLETTTGIEILFRQIAGFVARRVVSYAKEGDKVKLTDELGFIKFGSRVDIFLPPGTEVLVKPGQHVKGIIDKIALLNKD